MKNELFHHGILGQKWGVRRFQNKDGSLTAAGKRRQAKSYEKDLNKLDRSASKHALKKDQYEAKRDRIGGYQSILPRNFGPITTHLAKREKVLNKKIDQEYEAMKRDDKKIKKIEDHIRKSADYNFRSRPKLHEYPGVPISNFRPGNKYKVRTSDESKNRVLWNNKHINTKRTSRS